MNSLTELFVDQDTYTFHELSSILLLNSVPAALRRPQKKQVLDFQSMSYLRNSFVPQNSMPAALRRHQKKNTPGFSERVISVKSLKDGGRRPTGNGGSGGANAPPRKKVKKYSRPKMSYKSPCCTSTGRPLGARTKALALPQGVYIR